MPSHIRQKTFTTILLLILTACTSTSTEDSTIATAVALTVAAQNTAQGITQTPAVTATPIITQTPLKFSPTLTQLAPIASPTRAGNTKTSECAQASFISQTIPDETIFRPGEQFTQTWEIKNMSNCTWTTSYKIIFWDGDVLGGGYVYNLPQFTPPQGIVPISLVLVAPKSEGPYNSEWVLQTPDGTNFGVGEYSVPFFTKIVVPDDKRPVYTITNVEYEILRDPPTGCPANVTWTIIATVTTNGPFEFSYYWTQKDGNDSDPKPAEIEAAGSMTFTRAVKYGLAASPGEKWVEFNVSEPFLNSYGKAVFIKDCGQQ